MVGKPQKGLLHLDSNACWESRSPDSVQDVQSMTLPPGKRQRRLILSDNDEPLVKTRRAPPRLSSGPVASLPDRKSINQGGTPKKSRAKAALTASPKSSPEKANKLRSKEEKASKSLHTFFGRATEEQRWARKDKTPPNVVEDGEAGDDIQDDSLDEALAELPDGEGHEKRILDRRKPPKPTLVNGVLKITGDVVGSGQKFAKPSKPAAKEAKAVSRLDDDFLNRPWAERFAPMSLEESAVHKKKVADVQNWLSAVLQGRDRRVCDSRWRVFKGLLC
jgi:cell cycle checkpoint protein